RDIRGQEPAGGYLSQHGNHVLTTAGFLDTFCISSFCSSSPSSVERQVLMLPRSVIMCMPFK
ncbi:MAG: hypothetical protein ACKPKO_05895, partial [Candidatus Fonsibacter sp.]